MPLRGQKKCVVESVASHMQVKLQLSKVEVIGDVSELSTRKRESWTLQPEKPSTVQLCRRLRAEARKYHDLSCPYYKNESLLFFIPYKAKAAWVHRAKVYGLNRFLSPQH